MSTSNSGQKLSTAATSRGEAPIAADTRPDRLRVEGDVGEEAMRKHATIGEDGLRCEPIDIGGIWFYEEKIGLSVYCADRPGETRRGVIPLSTIRAYLRHIERGRRDKR